MKQLITSLSILAVMSVGLVTGCTSAANNQGAANNGSASNAPVNTAANTPANTANTAKFTSKTKLIVDASFDRFFVELLLDCLGIEHPSEEVERRGNYDEIEGGNEYAWNKDGRRGIGCS